MIHLAYLNWLEWAGEVGFVVALIWSIVTKPWTKSMWFAMKMWGSTILFSVIKDLAYVLSITENEIVRYCFAHEILCVSKAIIAVKINVNQIELFFILYQLYVVRNMLVDCITTTNIVNNTTIATATSAIPSYLSACGRQILKILTGPQSVEICTMCGIIIGAMAAAFSMTFGIAHLLT